MRCTRSNHIRLCRERRQRGFSLIEILVAMTITIIGLAGLMSVYTSAIQGNSRAARTVMASTVAHQTMEELRSLPVEAPVTGYSGRTLETLAGTSIPYFNHRLIDITTQDGTRFRREVSVEPVVLPNPVSNLLLVRVVVSWTDEGADLDTADTRLKHRIVLESIRTRQDLL